MCQWYIFNKHLIWGDGDGFNYILYTLIYLPFQVKPYSWKNVSYQWYLNHHHPLHWHHLLFLSQWQNRFYAGCAYENVSQMFIWQYNIAWLKQRKLNSKKIQHAALFFPSIHLWDPEAFPGQPRDMVPPTCPGSSWGSPTVGTSPEHLTSEVSGRHSH